MGCNYYGKLRFTKELKKKAHEFLDLEEFDKLKEILPKEIHIGKNSFGWKFIFNHNDWEYFGKQKKQLYHFLENCDIKDEYGEIISLGEFWVMIENKQDNESDLYTDTIDGLTFSKSIDFC